MLTPDKLPKHVAVIMDGNGRWAKQRGLLRSQGHLAGVDAVRTLVRESRKRGIEYVTVYAFSKENWNRPKADVGYLFELFLRFIHQEMPDLMAQDIRLAFIGNKKELPFAVRQALDYAIRKTENNKSMMFTLAINYSSRLEIVDAVRCAINDGICPEELTEERFRSYLYAPGMPDPDLIIRTSGELRLSNFYYSSVHTQSCILVQCYGPILMLLNLKRLLQNMPHEAAVSVKSDHLVRK